MSMIDVSNLTFGYEGSPELIFDHVGFQIDSGWKLGFTGRNGRGKTTFLRLLQGEYPYSGTISASVEFEYFPYEVANLSRTGLEVVREIAPEAEDWEIQRELGLLDRVMENGWKSLTAKETGRVGGILARRRKAIRSEGEAAKTEAKETAEAKYEN